MTSHGIAVELCYGGVWHSLTDEDDVYRSLVISTARYGASSTRSIDPGSTKVRLRSTDGKYNPENPMSPLYGNIGRSTPMRILFAGIAEDFEDESYNVQLSNSGDASWYRDNTSANEGLWSLRSGVIGDNKSSNVTITVPDGVNAISFAYKVSSEADYDFFRVYVDGVIELSVSGEVDWTMQQLNVLGASSVRFQYVKDEWASGGSDCARIDSVRFDDVRWTGEASEWRPSRSAAGFRMCDVTGGGMLRRLGIGNSPVVSAIASAVLALSPAAYIPMDDGYWADAIGSYSLGQPGFDLSAGFVRSQIEGPKGDPSKLPEFVTDSAVASPAVTMTMGEITQGSWTIDFDIRLKRLETDSIVLPMGLVLGSGGGQFGSVWTEAGDRLVSLSVWNKGNTAAIDLSATFDMFDAEWHHVRFKLAQSGGTATLSLYVDDTLLDSDSASLVPGGVHQIVLLGHNKTNAESLSIGHIGVYNGSPTSTYYAFTGYEGELAADRFQRICDQYGMIGSIVGTASDDSTPMGPQPMLAPSELLHDCAVTDGGIMYESATGELVLHCLGALYNQTPVMTVNVETDIVPPLDQVVGDRAIRNKIRVNRRGGSSAEYELTDGPMSTNPAPSGVGVHSTQVDVNPSSDSVLGDYAGWLVHVNTVEGVQYQQIVLDLDASPDIDTSAIEIGNTIALSGIPEIDDPSPQQQIITGVTELCDTHRRTITLDTTSAQPYMIGILDDSGYLDCSACTTSEALDSKETEIDVVCADNCAWGHVDGDYDITIGGERMTVTAVTTPTGSRGSYAQTLTVVRSVNRIVKEHSSGSEVHAAEPFIVPR